MTRGLYISAIGMKAQMNKMDVIANNLANVDTDGFKKDSVAFRSFEDELMLRIHDSGVTGAAYQPHEVAIGPLTSGVVADEVYTDFAMGQFRAVSDPFSAAISGGGFFTVRVTLPSGESVTRYTRDGNFTVDSQGALITRDGGYIQGASGDIRISLNNGDIDIDRYGNVTQNGQTINTLRITDFEDYTTLRKTGNNYYTTTEATRETPFTGMVAQGFIEASNVNPVKEMVEMINMSRVYEANQRFVTAMDTALQKAVNEVGRK